LFAKFDVPLSGYVVNRVLPPELAGEHCPPYLRNRLQMQGRHLDEIKKTLGNQVVGYVPELERDVTGLEMIKKLAGIMYNGNGNGRR
jgi:arsenite-transporting ATPase